MAKRKTNSEKKTRKSVKKKTYSKKAKGKK
jgi:hypothetical protein